MGGVAEAKPPPIPVVVDDGIRIEVSADSSEAVAKIPAGASCDQVSLMERIMKAGVISGVIEAAVAQAQKSSTKDRVVIVAKGTPPELSADARIEVMINFALKLSEDKDHHVDFREQDRFHEVEVGTVLAKLIPKKMGTPGRSVLGKEIAVRDPKDADLMTICGEGTKYLSVGDGQLVAERTGMLIRRKDGHLDIFPTVEIGSDLDMHTGNLTTKLPVNIKGDILGGFSLKSGADVTVGGVIEDARISVKGNLTCSGILQGKHRVKAHGDLKTKHATGREIKCRNLEVTSDLRGATVFATGSVVARLVISCKVTCGGSMVCEALGHPAELGGVIQVGVNPLAVALCQLANREYAAIETRITEARAKIKTMTTRLRTEKNPSKRQMHAQDLKGLLAVFERDAARLEECKRVINNKTLRSGNNPNATLTVNGNVYPGVEIRIGTDASMVVSKPLGNTVFSLKDGKVTFDLAVGDGAAKPTTSTATTTAPPPK